MPSTEQRSAEQRGTQAPRLPVAGLGRVFDICKGRIDDGPGLRTVVFMKGCRLGCPWCHNPESISSFVEISFSAERCIECGLCRQACRRDWSLGDPDAWRDGCELSAACVEVCPSKARKLVGTDLRVEEIVSAVSSDRDFFAGTDGGVTFSGGEPMLQADVVFEAARALREEGVHVAVETGGFFSPELVPPLAESVDLVLFDLKHVDEHKLTSTLAKGSPLILETLAGLADRDVAIEVHLTLIPGFNETEPDLRAIATWLLGLSRPLPVRVKPFHRLATAKHALYGTRYGYAGVEPVSRDDVLSASTYLTSLGLDVCMESI